MLIADREFAATVARRRWRRCSAAASGRRYRRSGAARPASALGSTTTRAFLAEGDPDFAWPPPDDEWQAIASTTPRAPPAIRRAWSITIAAPTCNALGNALTFGLSPRSVYLWTLPMFHCNGWTYTWAVTAGVRHACLPAPGRAGADLRRDRGARRDAYVRRADRAEHAGPRARPRRSAASPLRSRASIATGGAAPPLGGHRAPWRRWAST